LELDADGLVLSVQHFGDCQEVEKPNNTLQPYQNWNYYDGGSLIVVVVQLDDGGHQQHSQSTSKEKTEDKVEVVEELLCSGTHMKYTVVQLIFVIAFLAVKTIAYELL
jgi:hypothetical protein